MPWRRFSSRPATECSPPANGLEALKIALEQRPDLVISDVLMPAMDGYGLARRLRADPVTAGTRLMFYTAYFDRPEAKELAEAHGVACVLAKPSDNDAILAAVREALAATAEPLVGGGAGSRPRPAAHDGRPAAREDRRAGGRAAPRRAARTAPCR